MPRALRPAAILAAIVMTAFTFAQFSASSVTHNAPGFAPAISSQLTANFASLAHLVGYLVRAVL